jgi:hypothetical protein
MSQIFRSWCTCGVRPRSMSGHHAHYALHRHKGDGHRPTTEFRYAMVMADSWFRQSCSCGMADRAEIEHRADPPCPVYARWCCSDDDCFELHRDGAIVSLRQIDQEMCKHFGEPPDSTRWFRDWCDGAIGWFIATGANFSAIREELESDPCQAESIPVIDWLAARFVPKSRHEVNDRMSACMRESKASQSYA